LLKDREKDLCHVDNIAAAVGQSRRNIQRVKAEDRRRFDLYDVGTFAMLNNISKDEIYVIITAMVELRRCRQAR